MANGQGNGTYGGSAAQERARLAASAQAACFGPTQSPCPPSSPAACAGTVFPACPPNVMPVALDPAHTQQLISQIPSLGTIALDPYQGPTFRATPFFVRMRVVINVPVAVDPVANAGGIALGAADEANLTGTSTLVRTAAAVGQSIQAGFVDVPQGVAGVFTAMRVGSESEAGLRALGVAIQESGRILLDDQRATGNNEGGDLANGAGGPPVNIPIFIVIRPRQRITIFGANFDAHSAHILDIALEGRIWPVKAPDDSAQSAIPAPDQTAPKPWGCP